MNRSINERHVMLVDLDWGVVRLERTAHSSGITIYMFAPDDAENPFFQNSATLHIGEEKVDELITALQSVKAAKTPTPAGKQP